MDDMGRRKMVEIGVSFKQITVEGRDVELWLNLSHAPLPPVSINDYFVVEDRLKRHFIFWTGIMFHVR